MLAHIVSYPDRVSREGSLWRGRGGGDAEDHEEGRYSLQQGIVPARRDAHVDIITLPSSVPFDSSTLSVARPSGFGLGGIKTRIEGENVVYYTTFRKLGLSISIR